MDTILAIVAEALSMADDARRNGVVGATGYTDDGEPIGGSLTHDAMAWLAEARHMLASVGVPWSEMPI